MKHYIFKAQFVFVTLLVSVCFMACNKAEDCAYEMPCVGNQPNSELAGTTVATCFANKPGDPVGVVYYTKNNAVAPLGADWGTDPVNPVANIHPANWTVGDIGQIFGIAIDKDENIYLASSDIYFYGGAPKASSNGSSRPFGAGQIFKCVPPTYTAVPWVNLPSGIDALNGIGNIAYDKVNNQIFATNLEDGKIYRISMAGVIVETYDPWTADIGTPGIVAQDERVWGIGVNYEAGLVKVYFPRVTSISTQSVYSITLSAGAFPSGGSEIVDISSVPGNELIISDLAFSSDFNKILIAERGDPHKAKVMSYNKVGSVWAFNTQYFVGGFVGENSAGGVDFFYREINNAYRCNESFWASGNYLMAGNGRPTTPPFYVYGLEGIQYSGNNSVGDPVPTANQDTDLFIDFDGVNGGDKGGIGDVEVFDAAECFNLCPNKQP